MEKLSRSRLVLALVSLALLAVGATYFGGFGIRDERQDTQRSFTIGLITNNPNGLRNIMGFQDGMQALGYVAGENTTFLSSGKPVLG